MLSTIYPYFPVIFRVHSDFIIAKVVQQLKEDLNQPKITSLHFDKVIFNEELAEAFVHFLQTAA